VKTLSFPALNALRRLLGALLLGLVLVGCSGRVELLASVPEADANEVIAALINQGIDASKVSGKEGMVGVRVPANQSARAVDTLRVMGLPRERFAGMGEVFRKDGLISSPVEERARYLYALSQDLSATLSRIDGVLFARVHLVLPERGSGGEPPMPASAAVFIKHRSEANLEALQPQVRRLVTNSIPGLTSDRVSTVLVPSAVALPEPSDSPSNVLGVRVEAGSIWSLVALLIVLVLIAAAAAGAGVYWFLRRSGRIGAAPDDRAPPAP
jgi:type III secretion protein J